MYDIADRAELARELADAFLAGPWRVDSIAENGGGVLDRWPDWMEPLAMSVVAVHRSAPVDRWRELVGLIVRFLAERPAAPGDEGPPRLLRLLPVEPDLPPAHSLERWGRPRSYPLMHDWPIAPIPSVPELAERLELSVGQLAWLADVRSLERTVADERLRNYRYRALPRGDGRLPRLIEAPKARLKEVQRWVLREILQHVPAHDAAHGFVAGRSAITHARLHTRRQAVLRLDLKDFFASVRAGRVYRIFRTLGYSRPVAHVLTGLSTNVVPAAVWEQLPRTADPGLVQARFWFGRQLATPHLPQGAPTSPALANLAAYRLDRRLAGLADASGFRYSRYADDLTFSGPSRLRSGRESFEELVATIAREQGFALNRRKSSVRSAAARQTVCGVVVNDRPNLARPDYDRLKAILHNAARHGPAVENRADLPEFEAHLRGRIAWVSALNAARGEKLRRRFDEITWGAEAGS